MYASIYCNIVEGTCNMSQEVARIAKFNYQAAKQKDEWTDRHAQDEAIPIHVFCIRQLINTFCHYVPRTLPLLVLLNVDLLPKHNMFNDGDDLLFSFPDPLNRDMILLGLSFSKENAQAN